MASDLSDPRPLSPHLQVWRWHATMASSILHRVSGIGLYIGALLAAIWIILVATGNFEPVHAALFTGFMAWPAKIGLILLTYCAVYHWLNGLRHLVWDFGKGFDPQGSNLRSVAIIVLAASATIVLWFAYGGLI